MTTLKVLGYDPSLPHHENRPKIQAGCHVWKTFGPITYTPIFDTAIPSDPNDREDESLVLYDLQPILESEVGPLQSENGKAWFMFSLEYRWYGSHSESVRFHMELVLQKQEWGRLYEDIAAITIGRNGSRSGEPITSSWNHEIRVKPNGQYSLRLAHRLVLHEGEKGLVESLVLQRGLVFVYNNLDPKTPIPHHGPCPNC